MQRLLWKLGCDGSINQYSNRQSQRSNHDGNFNEACRVSWKKVLFSRKNWTTKIRFSQQSQRRINLIQFFLFVHKILPKPSLIFFLFFLFLSMSIILLFFAEIILKFSIFFIIFLFLLSRCILYSGIIKSLSGIMFILNLCFFSKKRISFLK